MGSPSLLKGSTTDLSQGTVILLGEQCLETVGRPLTGIDLEGLSSSTLEPLLRPQHREDQQRTGQPDQR